MPLIIGYLIRTLNKTTLTILQVQAWLFKRSSRAFDNQFSGSTPDVSFRLSFLASALFVFTNHRQETELVLWIQQDKI